MQEYRQKHLEMIQAVVSRLAGNSFVYKGWAITLVAGLFALGAKDAQPMYLLVALIPAVGFWALDAYYLRQERLFRQLYDAVRVMDEQSWSADPYSMDTRPYDGEVAPWASVLISKTIAGLYAPLVLVVLAVSLFALLAYVAPLIHCVARCGFR